MTATIDHPTKPTANRLAVDAKKLAELLGVSLRHVRRLDSSGKLPAPVRIGGAVRWSVATINTWLEWGCPDRQDFNARLKTEGKRHA